MKENTSSPASFTNFSAPTIVVDALFERTGRTDIDAARASSQKAVQTQTQASRLRKSHAIRTAQIRPNIANPVGLLIRALPSRCAAESIANYRDHWRKEDDQDERRREQDRAQILETARSILDSLNQGEEWDNATLELAKGILAEDAVTQTAKG